MNELERRTLLGVAGIGALAAIAKAGPLSPPPGAVSSTAKPLGEVEPRTAVNAANTPGDAGSAFNITQPGSYYLAANITVTTDSGITITADNVTLDLNGFAISSSASGGSGTAVAISGVRTGISIRNGHIRGATTYGAEAFTPGGFVHGIAAAPGCSGIRVSDVGVTALAGDGIRLGTVADISNAAHRCTAHICAGIGILASLVADCAAGATGETAISGSIVTACRGETVGSGTSRYGILADSVAENCRGIALSAAGVQAAVARNCHGVSSSNAGLLASFSADSCTGTSTSGTGVVATLATNCFGQSTSFNGLNASNAVNCYGITSTGTGMNIQGTATSCRGQRSGGVAIIAGIAVSCTTTAGTVSSANKFLGTP